MLTAKTSTYLALTITAFLTLGTPLTYAQVASQSINDTAYPLDAVTLYTPNNGLIRLWGVEAAFPAGTQQNLLARGAMAEIIGDANVRCIPMSRAPSQPNAARLAQCLNAQERDIALLLLNSGLAGINARQIHGHELGTAYRQAERQARQAGLGIWNAGIAAPAVTAAPAALPINPTSLPIGLIAALLLVPVAGFILTASLLRSGFKELISLQKFQIAGNQKRDRELKIREKHMVATALEAEINTNRAKLDAYLIIYEEMLKSLRDPTKTPKYQRAGDIIHDKPALTRTVYDSNLDKLDLLGTDLTTRLAVLYQDIDPNPDYRTLEPDLPIEKVWETIERIIRNAEKMTEPMDQLVGALNVIVRDKRL